MAVGVRWTEYGGRGFFSRDGLLALWLALLVDELDRQPRVEPWLVAFRNDLHDQATVRFDGLVETRMDAHVSNETRRLELITFCRALRARIARGEPLSDGVSGAVGGHRWRRRETPAGLLRTADAFLWLLEAES